MHHNFVFTDVNEALPPLLNHLSKADEVGSRVGRTKEMTHVGITLTHPWNREILLPARKPNLAAQIAETMWVLGGRYDMGFLLHYLPRAAEFSDDGETWRAGYGARLRRWEGVDQFGRHAPTLDQIAWVYDHLRKDPSSRRAVLSIWDPVMDTEDGVKDIPCNDWLNFSSRLGYLDLHVAVRSNDVIWGWSGINQFEWSALLEVMAGLLGLRTGALHFSTTSFHIYDRHWAKADKIVDHAPVPRVLNNQADSPRFSVHPGAENFRSKMDWFDQCVIDWFAIEEQIRSGKNMDDEVNRFPEPMLQSWLRVLQWWWTGEKEYMAPLEGTRLDSATHYSVQPPEREIIHLMADDRPVHSFQVHSPHSEFIRAAINLHNEKHEAYGDSWKKRGESFSIIPNIARKVDRLGGSETADETSADTALDLMVYLAKYEVWLSEQAQGPVFLNWGGSDDTGAANEILLSTDIEVSEVLAGYVDNADLVDNLKARFEGSLLPAVEGAKHDKTRVVQNMLQEAYALARRLWESEQDQYRGADVD